MNRSQKLLVHLSALMLAIAVVGAGEAAAQGVPASTNQPTLAADEARHMFGDWSLTLATPDGNLPLSFTIGERDGKVAVFFGGADGQAITNCGESI